MAALAVAALGCGTSDFQPLNRTVLRATHPQTLAIAVSRGPYAGIGAGNLAEAFAASRAKAKIGMLNPIPDDPVVAIRQNVGAALAKRFALQIRDTGGVVTEASTADDLIKDYPGSDLILDIRTTEWSISKADLGNATGAEHMALRYKGVLRLIDARQKSVVAASSCTSVPVDAADMPTLDQLIDNNGALLRSALAELAAYCTDDYRKRALGLY